MGTKITIAGKQKIEADIQQLINGLKELRKEKVVAYNLAGDTWHDNPYFNKLEQEEREFNTKINDLNTILKNAEIIEDNSRNMETVEIGSIVKCFCKYSDLEETVVLEIVGYGETDIDNGKIHYESLVAKNILGLHVNDIVSFNIPSGKVQYKILSFYEDWADVEDE